MKIVLSIIFMFLSGCSFMYVAKQGAYQLKLLAGAEPIEEALRSRNLDKKQRNKLILISQARQFGHDKLKLVMNKNYKNINLFWKHIIYNISASEQLEFKPYLWWFPIIGAVPYKGYFIEKDADEEVKRLKALGLDTHKRRVGGYSTLGYFSDPVWPTMLQMRDEALVELIIHELTHATVYIPNHTAFNETLANFVGKTGARMFYVDKYGEKSQQVARLDKFYQDEEIYNKFFTDLYAKLDVIYAKNITPEEKKEEQKLAIKQAQEDYQKLAINLEYKINWDKVNNAYLLSFKAYNFDEKVFSDLFAQVNNNFERFFEHVANYSPGTDPFASLRKFLSQQAGRL